MTAEEDHKTLQQIVNLSFPESIRYEDGFLDITDQRFKETAISRAYAYFLKKDDILIDNKSAKTCIIIENKVFHWLNNDLDDYWNHSEYPDTNKIGVVLSIRQVNHGNDHFTNITHGEWMGRIRGNIPHDLTPREYVYLADFIKHMESLSKSSEMTDNVKFFFEHAEKVIRANAIYKEAKLYLQKQLEITASLMDWDIWGGSEGYRHIQPKSSEKKAFYAISYPGFFTENPEIKVIVELGGKTVARHQEMKELLASNNQYEKIEMGAASGSGWVHIASKTYQLTNENIASLSEFLISNIQEDFSAAMQLVLGRLAEPSIS